MNIQKIVDSTFEDSLDKDPGIIEATIPEVSVLEITVIEVFSKPSNDFMWVARLAK